MTTPRPDLFVLARFLAALAQRDLTRSRLQLAARVNYDILRRYVDLMEEREWMVWQEHDGNDVAHLTPAGRQVHEELQAWLLRLLGRTVL